LTVDLQSAVGAGVAKDGVSLSVTFQPQMLGMGVGAGIGVMNMIDVEDWDCNG